MNFNFQAYMSYILKEATATAAEKPEGFVWDEQLLPLSHGSVVFHIYKSLYILKRLNRR